MANVKGESDSNGNLIHILRDGETVLNFVRKLTECGEQEDAFHVLNIDDLIRNYNDFKHSLPRVTPFYGNFITHNNPSFKSCS